MRTVYKVNILKTIFLLTYFLFVLTAYFSWAQSPEDCGELSFKTDIIKFEKIESCYDVVLEISNDGNCRYELSHVNFDFGCGTISNASNSQGWAMELNQIDPTTGIGGIKIDDIENFGKDPEFTSFQVEFTFCPDQECNENALISSVAYKAGQCVYYEKPVLEQEEDEDDEEQSELIVSTKKTDPSCSNESEGSIELIISEGTAPYEIIWNTGQTEFILQNLTAGSYSYIVTDASGKQAEGEVILENPALFNINATLTHPDCQGVNSGSIDIDIEGGTAPYTFLWSTGLSTQNLTNLYAGIYNVQVTDASGCSVDKMISLINSTSIQIEALVTQPSCQEGIAGSIALSATGGTEPYTFSWSNNMESATIDGLSDGYYRVTITDQNGCSYSKTYSIITDVGITAFASVSKTNCFDDPIGAIDLTISGGTEPYTIEWSNEATTEDIDGLVAGNYTATITDALGCQKIYKTSVSKDDIVIKYGNVTIPSCNGSDDGAIDISILNGTEPYTFSWSNGSGDEDISGLSTGMFTLIVTDAKGCVAEKSFNLPEPDPIQIAYEIISKECTGSQDIIINATGGSMGYTYIWSDGSTSSQLNDVIPGTYTVVVTDSKSCTATQEIVVTEQPQYPECIIQDLVSEVICGSAGNILMSATSDAISYSWTVSSSDGSWTVASPVDQAQILFSAGTAGSNATFTLTIQYEGGCETTCEKIIEVCSDDGNTDDGSTDDGSTGDDGSADDETTDDDGSADDDNTGNEDDSWNKDKDCDECFFTNPVLISKSDNGYSYAIEVNHDDCRYELSHLTIEIPACFKIMDYSNSMNWKMESVNNDPATGLTGIKIDDIPSFGKDEDRASFMVYMTLSADDPCRDDLKCFSPVIAYKASTCVYEETTQSECVKDFTATAVHTYPNPTQDFVVISMAPIDIETSYTVDLFDFHGEKIDSYLFQNGATNECIIDLTPWKDGLYLLHVISSNGFRSIHKVIKK